MTLDILNDVTIYKTHIRHVESYTSVINVWPTATYRKIPINLVIVILCCTFSLKLGKMYHINTSIHNLQSRLHSIKNAYKLRLLDSNLVINFRQ